MTTFPLDPTRQSLEAEAFAAALRERVVGQDGAIQRLAEVYQVYLAGLAAPGRPLANLLFLGPTGTGKTRIVEAMGEALFGDVKAVVKIDCSELQHSHEISKLIGSPPGYLGHRETQPLITQETLDQHHTEKLKLSLVLFDEIEKASDALWQLLLGVLDKAALALGDNRRVDFSRTMIFMTSNLGAREMARLMEGGMGFRASRGEGGKELDAKLERTAIDVARRKFSPEFMNRIDKVMVFRPLGRAEFGQVLGIELARIGERIAASTSGGPLIFECTAAVREFLLEAGIDGRYGARRLKRALERHLVFPFANLIATGQIGEGDMVVANHDALNGCLSFAKRACEALVRVAAA